MRFLGKFLKIRRVSLELKKEDDGYPIGSGVFIDIGGVKRILNAKHVAKIILEYPNDKLGLLLEEKEHNYILENRYLLIYQYDFDKQLDEYAPDLSFIKIPSNQISTIQAIKSFYNFSIDRNKLLKFKNDFREGIWFVCGFPVWESSRFIDGLHFKITYSIIGRCGATGVDKATYKNELDYYEVGVDYSSLASIPKDFGGISGGGLWKITINNDGENFIPESYYLCGIVIEQTQFDQELNKKKLICLGRKSLYEKFYVFLRNELIT